jgi:transcription elongation GreA/GreB family factor
MNKELLVKNFTDQLKKDLKLAKDAVAMAYESATDKENIAECKYDTKGLEASYLVQGQARRVEELEEALEAFICLKVKPLEKVLLNALVVLKNELGTEEFIFIGPASGGLKISFDQQEVIIVTPVSPLGRALLGKTAGNSVEVAIGKKNKFYKVLTVD